MADNDFLSQFSGQGVPDSFKEEERKPVERKPKKPINKFVLIGVCTGVIVVLVLVYFIFLAPKIEMPDFVYQTKNDVSAWVKQQKIETTGIIFNEEYSFEYDADTILNQDVEPGTKLKEDAKITFTISKGADPDESVSVPDLQSMDKAEIKEWISTNKLTKTKVSTAYSDTVEEDQVISVTYSGCEEDTFTRSCSLKISVSKGVAPAGTLTVDDFSKQLYSVVETWAKGKNITLKKEEAYSSEVDKGYVISQSVAAKQTMKEGDTLTVVVSKGKAVKVIDLTGYLQEDATNWCTENDLTVKTKVRYTDDDEECGNVVSQSIAAGKVVSSGETIELTVSKGRLRVTSFTGTTKDDVRAWIKDANVYGAELVLGHPSYEISDTVAAGKIIRIDIDDNEVDYVVSKGKNIYIDPAGYTKDSDTLKFGEILTTPYTEAQVRALCEKAEVSYQISYITGEATETVGNVKRVKRGDPSVEINPADLESTYITQDDVLTFEVISKLAS